MRKVQFTEDETVALSVALQREIERAEEYRRRMRGWIARAQNMGEAPSKDDLAGYDYWTQQAKILRSAMVKLRGKEGGGEDDD